MAGTRKATEDAWNAKKILVQRSAHTHDDLISTTVLGSILAIICPHCTATEVAEVTSKATTDAPEHEYT